MKRTRNRPHADRIDEAGLTRIAGWSAVSAIFKTAPDRVERLFFDDQKKAQVKEFCLELARARKPYRLVAADELERIAGTPMHGGIVAVAKPAPIKPFDPAQAKTWTGDLLLMLDGIGNPHNLGAIVRTAAFFGLPRIVLSDNPAQANPSGASYRVAEGGFEYVSLYRAARFASAVKDLRQSHYVVGAAPGRHAEASALRVRDRPLALILGNEEDGVPRATLNACDEIVAIPGKGRVQSLNVAATAAILIYALSSKPPAAR